MTDAIGAMPFRARFYQPILNGTKTATSRTKCYGKAGDVLDTSVGAIELTLVYRNRAVTRR